MYMWRSYMWRSYVWRSHVWGSHVWRSHMQRSEDNFCELVFSFYHVGPRDRVQTLRSSEYPQNHLTSSP